MMDGGYTAQYFGPKIGVGSSIGAWIDRCKGGSAGGPRLRLPGRLGAFERHLDQLP